jgi:hypothetical protein
MSPTTASRSTAADTSAGPASRLSTERMAGVAAIAFGVGVVAANAFVAGAPMADASVAEAASWFAANRLRVVLANAMVALTFPALLVFSSAMFELGRAREVSRRWMLVGGLGGAAMVGVFALVVAANIAGVILAEAGGAAFTAAWTMHWAAFALNMTALGTAFLGFTLGAHAAGIIPGWQRTMGVVGAVLLMATGFANTAVAENTQIGLAGFAGFLLWLVWIIITGVRLLRVPAR